MSYKYLSISVIFQNDNSNSLDIKVRENIKVQTLITEITQYLERPMPIFYSIKVKSKGFILEGHQKLSDFLLTDGDILEIAEDK